MADLERKIVTESRSVLGDQAYAAEIYNTVVVDWDEARSLANVSVRQVGTEFYGLSVRPFEDPRTGGQRYAVYASYEEEDLSDFNSLKSAQAAYRERVVARAGDRSTAWTATDVRAAQALQTKNGYSVGSDLTRPTAREAAAMQESLLDLAGEQTELTITAERELTVEAETIDGISDEERELLAEYDQQREAAAEAEAEQPEEAELSAAEQFVLSEEFLAPYEAERAAREAEAEASIQASTGTYTPQEWSALLDGFGDPQIEEGEAEYDADRFAPSQYGEDGLRELTAGEIETREALWEAIYEHGEDLGNEAVVSAYNSAIAATQQAEEAELDRVAEAAVAEIWSERGEFLAELQQEAGATEEQQGALAASIESLRASEWLAEDNALDEEAETGEPGATAAAAESLRASEWLNQQPAEAEEQSTQTAPAAQPVPAAAPAEVAEQAAPAEVAEQSGAGVEPSEVVQAELVEEAAPAPGLREAMGELLQALQENEEYQARPEYDQLTALWASGEQFWNQAGALVSHYGQELREDVRMQGAVRGVGTFLADGIAGASTRMSGWMIANEAADHPVTRALQKLAGAAQNWAERLRGNDPVAAFEEFRGRADAVSTLVAAEREQLEQTPQVRDGGELEGGESAADLVAELFDGAPVERMHEAVAAAEAAEVTGQAPKQERPKAAALAAQGSGIEL
jgi:hypothetical protein